MIPLPFASHRRFFVLGFGKSGRASAAALQKAGAVVLVWDDKEASRAAAAGAGYGVVDPALMDWQGLEAMIMAPGIPLTHPAPHVAVLKAREANVPILSDLDLLFAACPRATYVGITGTNGKSTTTALVGHILSQAGRAVQVGGNIGTPALSLEPLGKDGIYVLELSSYQLDLIQTNPLDIAVWLNVTPDHYERHGDLAGYIAAKRRIVRQNAPQTLVMGTDEPEMAALFAELHEQTNLTIHELSARHNVSQGIKAQDQKLYITNESEPLDLKEMKALPGAHNAQNAAAAFAACHALGLRRAEIEEGLRSFPGLAHRQQLVAEIEGVRFINDSKATNADAASKALACYDTIYWIIGGQAKPGGLNGLEDFMPRVVHAFLIGEASDSFATWCDGKVPFTPCRTLDAAVEKAALMAWKDKKNDAVILLSPACASWDQFQSFEHRGDSFAALVRNLKKES